jgi:hypothetical protein
MSVFKEVMESLFGKKNSFNNVTIINGSIVGGKIPKEDYGPVVNHPVQFKDFSSVSIVGPFETVIQQGENLTIQLEINEKLIPFLKVETVKGCFKIKVEKDVLINPVMKLFITAPLLESITHNGSGKVDIQEFKQEKINIEKSGTGKCALTGDFDTILLDILGTGSFNAKFNAYEATVNKESTGDCFISGRVLNSVFTISGTGSFEYDGESSQSIKIKQDSVGSSTFYGDCENLNLTTSGTGSVDAKGLKAYNVTLISSGIGKVNVTALKSIVGSATGIGGIHIFGNPANARVTKKSIGELVYH